MADVYERHARHFADLLVHTIDKPQLPVQALDLDCGTGYPTLQALKVLPIGSRVVALSGSRPRLTEFHKVLTPEVRQSVFVRKEEPTRLPFAQSTFDLAWICLSAHVLQPIKPVVRQAMRVLRPGGMLVVCAPLQGSFLELTGAIAGLGEADVHQLLGDRPEFRTAEQWERLMLRAGGIEVKVNRSTFQILSEPPISRDRLLAMHLLPMWLGRDPTDTAARDIIDRAISTKITTTVQLAAIAARRGHSEIEESSVG